MTNNYNLHLELMDLSKAAYNNNFGKKINEWECVDEKMYKNGYHAQAFKKGNKIIIVSRGTEPGSIKDLYNDFNLVSGDIPSQLNSAKDFYSKIKDKYGLDNRIILTGHSLGGSISQALGAETGAETVTFAAYGINHIPGLNKNFSDNITNYGDVSDPFFILNINNQIGNTKVLNTGMKNDEKVSSLKKQIGAKDFNIKKHFIENWNNVVNNVEYKNPVSRIFNGGHNKVPLFKMGIEKNVDLSGENHENILNNGFINTQKTSGILNKNKLKELFDNLQNKWQKNQLPIKSNRIFKTQLDNHLNNIEHTENMNKNSEQSFFNSYNNNFNSAKTDMTGLLRQQIHNNNNLGIDNKNLLEKNSTFGGISNEFMSSIKGKKYQDLTDEERLKAIWKFL